MKKRSASAAVLAALTLTGCGSGTSSTLSSAASSPSSTTITAATTPSTSATTTRASASPCITKGGYAGLYATVSAFDSNNNTVQDEARGRTF